MNKRLSCLSILLIIVFSYGCSSNPLDIELTNSNTNIQYTNIDALLFNQSKEKIEKELQDIEKKIGDLPFYELSQNLQQKITDSSAGAIQSFYNSDYIADLEKEKKELANQLPKIEDKIDQAFQYLSHHFGDTIIPEDIFYINKLFSQITCSDNSIAVGLENYISPNSEVIKSIPNTQLYQWQRDRMDIDYLKRDLVLNWIQVHLFNEIDGKLAEHIIQAGKILYVLNAAFPKATEAYLLRYNDEDHQWAIENESMVWNYIVKQQMLFKTNISERTNFLNEGPTTVGLSESSPDRIGQFLGYRIVKGYMHKNKALSLPELIETKYNKILQTYEIQ